MGEPKDMDSTTNTASRPKKRHSHDFNGDSASCKRLKSENTSEQ